VVFKLDWREVVEGRMESYRVVECFDVIKEHGLSLLQVAWDLALEALGFEGGPEAFHGGVIVTAGLTAHAWGDLAGEQELAKGTGGILDSAIRMMELWTARPEFKRPLESFFNQGSGQGSRDFPAHQTFGAQIQFGGQIQPAIFLRRQVGYISTPNLVGRTGGKR